MSIRLGLMALLTHRPMHGYQLRQEFEARTGGTWPLNIGQVYTTLQRLVRDGVVEAATQGDAASTRDEGTVEYQLTPAGRAEIDSWWTTPVLRGAPARDELAIKLALAVTVPGVDVVTVVQRQRSETMRALRDYTLLKRKPGGGGSDDRSELAWSLVLDNLVFAAEAEMRWLDHVEARLGQAARHRSRNENARWSGDATRGAAATQGDVGGSERADSRASVETRGTREVQR